MPDLGCTRIRALGEGRQQLGDAAVEGVAFLEEEAVDVGAKAPVGGDHDRGQQQRERDLAGRRTNS